MILFGIAININGTGMHISMRLFIPNFIFKEITSIISTRANFAVVEKIKQVPMHRASFAEKSKFSAVYTDCSVNVAFSKNQNNNNKN